MPRIAEHPFCKKKGSKKTLNTREKKLASCHVMQSHVMQSHVMSFHFRLFYFMSSHVTC